MDRVEISQVEGLSCHICSVADKVVDFILCLINEIVKETSVTIGRIEDFAIPDARDV